MQAGNDELLTYQRQLQAFLDETTQRANVPGICLALSANGVRLTAVTGHLSVDRQFPMTPDARFEIGSISKVLLSLIVLDLIEQQKLDLDSPIARYLPELGNSQIGQHVLLWHVLCHSGGYKAPNFSQLEVQQAYSWEKLVTFLNTTEFLFKPGTVFSFTPTAPALLAKIIFRATGLPAAEIARTRLLGALGLHIGTRDGDATQPDKHVLAHSLNASGTQYSRATRFQLGDFWMQSHFDFTLSTADLLTFCEALMNARQGSPAASAFIKSKTALMSQHQTITLPAMSSGPRTEQLAISAGLGCAEFLPSWFGYNGPFIGQSSCFRYHEKEPVALAIGVNASAPFLCDAITREILRSLLGEVPTLAPQVVENALTVTEMAGTYLGSSGGYAKISANGSTVICETSLRPNLPTLRATLKQDDYQRWVINANPGLMPIGFFRDPVTGIPAFMAGHTAFRKAR